VDLSVRDAAERLGVDESRVRVLLRRGDLAGRRVAGRWLVLAEDVARRASFAPMDGRLAGGRPMSPARGWALLDLLDGGDAAWLSPSARSQVRSLARRLAGAEASRWRAVLRARSDVLPVRAHPAAVDRLPGEPDVRMGGPSRAAAAGLDLVAFDSLPELYIRPEAWPALVTRYALEVGPGEPAFLARLPRGSWWPDSDALSAPVVAADMLEQAEPRAVAAAVALLNERAAGIRSVQ
jgi:hypothetical protein